MILCVGTTPAVQRSMTFESLTIDEVNRAVKVEESAAGKSLNVARVLATLGKPVLATGFLGGDTGHFLRGELDREHVAHDFVEVPFRTRTCTTILDRKADTITELVEESQGVEERYWTQLLQKVGACVGRCQALVLSGSLPPQAPQDFYARCCELASPAGVPVILDARGEPLRHAMKYRPIMVKPNRSELGSTFGFAVETDALLKDAIRRLVDLGAQAALITMGAKGAVLSDGREFWSIASPRVEVVNPIGSGDSVAAGYTAALVEGRSLVECAIAGIACGAANAMTPTPGVVRPEEVERLQKSIEAKPF